MFERGVLAAGGARPERAPSPHAAISPPSDAFFPPTCAIEPTPTWLKGQNVLDHAGSLWVCSSSWPVEVTEG